MGAKVQPKAAGAATEGDRDEKDAEREREPACARPGRGPPLSVSAALELSVSLSPANDLPPTTLRPHLGLVHGQFRYRTGEVVARLLAYLVLFFN